mmetsp:Transcript_3021/g.4977  ORF Transcript_3021/g.4977 Transcript_3021/m.4977 type:complete len:514 (-) Transcript_3021:51-1592(-)
MLHYIGRRRLSPQRDFAPSNTLHHNQTMKFYTGTFLLLLSISATANAQTGGALSECANGGCRLGEYCVGNSFLKDVDDTGEYGCAKCNGNRDWWPCNFETTCFCHAEGAPRIPPAPRSGVNVNTALDACRDVLTEDIFNNIVQPNSEEGKQLFTYAGLCDAIANYNQYHDEKFAQMGTISQVRQELSAFLSHASVETDGFSVTREEHHCVNPITGLDGNVYCMPCKEQFYSKETKTCTQSYFVNEQTYNEYCDLSRQNNQGCSCTVAGVSMANVPLQNDARAPAIGYVRADDMFFRRGSFDTSFNYGYMGAGIAIKGDAQYFCEQPDLLATNPQYAWQSGIYKWMEYQPYEFASTAHKQVLKGNFGGTINILNGPLECPSSMNISEKHFQMVRDRVREVCRVGSSLGVMLELNSCENPYERDCQTCDGIEEIYYSCQQDGSCPDCIGWGENLASTAPTITPAIIKPPTFEEWGKYWGPSSQTGTRNGATSSYSSPVWYTMTSLVVVMSAYLME